MNPDSGLKVLVVDDNMVNRVSMEKIMSEFGSVESKKSGQEAVYAFETNLQFGRNYDLVLLDIIMPDIDGLKVLQKMRAIEKEYELSAKERAKIFMVTSHAHKDIVLSSLKIGCDDYIVKPLQREIIVEKLLEFGFKINNA